MKGNISNEKYKWIPKRWVSAYELADFTGYVQQRISQLEKDHVITRTDKGFELKSSIQALFAHLRRTIHGNRIEKGEAEKSKEFWQTEKLKQQVLDWRYEYAQNLMLPFASKIAEVIRRGDADGKTLEQIQSDVMAVDWEAVFLDAEDIDEAEGGEDDSEKA